MLDQSSFLDIARRLEQAGSEQAKPFGTWFSHPHAALDLSPHEPEPLLNSVQLGAPTVRARP